MESTVLIADSGSTKTDWALGSQRYKTQGINPFHQDEVTISHVLADELLPQIADGVSVSAVMFYGSGVRPELEPLMARLLAEAFPCAEKIEAHSDLLGAARALCGDSEGIACILGTGANSCLYDGQRIVANTPPLGYILGDEGSGAVLGRLFLNALYKGRLDMNLRTAFEKWIHTDMANVIDRVYRLPMPNRWLASLAPFIHDHLDNPDVERLVIDNFRSFVRNNLLNYRRPDLPVSAVGSIAYYFHPQLETALQVEGYCLGRILRSPIDAF